MKKIIICLLFVMIASQFSCKKFLDITPIDKLTGNNFYQSATDVESNLTDMYGQLYDKYTQTNTAGGTGEMRSGEVIPANNTQGSGTRVIRYDAALIGGHQRSVSNSGTNQGPQTIPTTAVNDRLLLNAIQTSFNGNANVYLFQNLTFWAEYYRIIQGANILVSKLQEGIPALTADQTKGYIAEAKFIRCYCYFVMVRLYGNVVYYTTPYQKDALPRMDMVTVISNCIADLTPSKNDLPPNITNPSLRGVRASRGAIIGLLMNMNMWNAGFDPAHATQYYTTTAALGAEIRNSGAFQLLAMADWNTVTKGRSSESLFELFSTVNYSTKIPFLLAPFGESFIHYPYRLPEYDWRSSPCIFTGPYMQKLFPIASSASDLRLSTWFEAPYDQNAETFQLKKFAGNTIIDSSDPNNNAIPDNTFLIMRYSDAILLEAEAQADLGNTTAAEFALNMVRGRAAAPPYSPGQGGDATYKNLSDAIFYERAKELIGEGSHYFDLVRTKRILSKAYTDNPLTLDKFNRGGWTWPIDASALTNNPYMTLNSYWVGTGIQ